MMIELPTPPVTWWACQRCNYVDVTRQWGPHVRMHPCAGFGLAVMPMVIFIDGRAQGTQRVIPREDYVGRESVTYDAAGRAIMAASIDRADGTNDLVVFPAAARMDM